MELLTAKLTLAVAVFVIGWLGGRMVLGGETVGRGWLLSGGNAFAAGIFLGTGLIHVLGESAAAWHDLGWDYPIAFVLAAAAFCLILLFEHVLLPDEAHAMIHAHTGDPEADDHGHRHGHDADPSPYALVVALSAHSVLAGLALGAQQLLASTFMIALAILAHKGTAGLALGIRLARSGMAITRARRFVLLFALMTPLGILLGMASSGLLRHCLGTRRRHVSLHRLDRHASGRVSAAREPVGEVVVGGRRAGGHRRSGALGLIGSRSARGR